jgi:ubiquinol-cytochrome c reductase cytochrome c1 subunit
MYTAAVPLDLSNVATIFDEKFLKNFIKNPANAAFDSTYRLHKKKQMHLDLANAESEAEQAEIKDTVTKDIASFQGKPKIGMYGFDFLGDQAINDIVAYLKFIAKPLTAKESLELACARCHGVAYAKIEATTPAKQLSKYLGTTPPDLSMMIRSKGEDYLTVFLNDPQKVLIGSSMPRVGINEETEDKIVSYLETIGDSKKEERESLGIWVILYFVIFTILAYLWKRQIWKEVK